MHRFPQQDLLTERAPTEPLIDRLAERVAEFHLGLTPAPPETPFGEPEAVLAPMLDNIGPIRSALADCRDAGPLCLQLDRLERWTRKRFERLRPVLEARRRAGAIRECHGDMHRGNIVVINDEPVIFDCIEFNPSLRWIDPMSEIAFLAMDLAEAGERGLAQRFLNRYFELTGDYGGAPLLRFYQVYRALVRAKVSAIRFLQTTSRARQSEAPSPLKHYLGLARQCSGRHRPQLFVTHGLSGSGKTYLGSRLQEQLPIIRLRSDVERKRLFGVPERHRPMSHQAATLYGQDATRRTYARLLNLARELLKAGFSVLVDATFLTYAQRAPFLDLARELACPFWLLVLEAPLSVLRERVERRRCEGNDASDATIDVLAWQLARLEPLREDERPDALYFDTEHPLEVEPLLMRILRKADAPPLCNGTSTPVATG
jgi:predicted kinase